MGIMEQEKLEEERRVQHIAGEIDQRIDALQQHVSNKRANIVDIRKSFWDDVRVNLDDHIEAAETMRSIKQQADLLSEKERSYEHVQKQLAILSRLKQSPYFGRIDFVEEGENQSERIYVGITSLVDESDMHFLVYDWRAPVSSLYYDYPPGPAGYETPSGTITGTMELKRQFIVRDGLLRSMFDTGVTIGDEILQEVLGKQADAQMKSIVATIQKEQNRIIRNERSRLLVVQGAAGSGKTSAALQRVAYLLYRYRETLRAENIVLFSPNPIFNSYISTVLPELGEENMQQTTYQEYVEHRLGGAFQLENPFTQMEYALTAMNEQGYAERMEGIRYKASTDFIEVIEQYVTFLGNEGMIFKNVMFRDNVLISAGQIKERFYALDSVLKLPNRMILIREWLLKELKEMARLEKTKSWVEDEIELLDNDAYAWAHQELNRNKRFNEDTFDDVDREKELLTAKVIAEYFKPIRTFVKQLDFIDIPAVYQQFFADPQYNLRFFYDVRLPNDWPTICRQTVEGLERFELAYEDITPYLYLKDRIEGFKTNNSVRHVFIDEAQDYSPFQFAFIRRLFPHSKMTVLGDLNQAIYTHSTNNNGFESLYPLYENEQHETIILTRTYRSTRQIVEFTRAFITGGEAIEPFNRDGSKPTLTQTIDSSENATKIVDRLHTLQATGHRTIAVICKSTRESEGAYEALQGHVPVRLIKNETSSFEAGMLVIPSFLAKGVEFDAVIIYNGSREQYGRESERKLFYTACTRAMHELHVYSIGEVSPFISVVSTETYTVL